MKRLSALIPAVVALLISASPAAAAGSVSGTYVTPGGDVEFALAQGMADFGYCSPQNTQSVCFNVNSTALDPVHHVQPRAHIVAKDMVSSHVPMFIEFISNQTCSDPSNPANLCVRMSSAARMCDSGSVEIPEGASWMAVGVSTNGENSTIGTSPDVSVICPGEADHALPYVGTTGVEVPTTGTITAWGDSGSVTALAPSGTRTGLGLPHNFLWL